MSRSFRFSIGLLVILIGILTACGGAAPETDNDAATTVPQATPVTPQLPANDSGIPLVARVNGAEITLPEFQRALERRQQFVVNAANVTTLENEVLDQLIEQVLIEQAAAGMGLGISDEELQVQVQENINLAGSEAAWQEWLATNMYTADEFNTTLRETLVANLVRDRVIQDIQGDVPQAHTRHILVATLAEANDLLAQLGAGADFTGLAAAHSLDASTREAGGDLGWFPRDGLITPELADVALSLQPGQIAGPIETSLGFHIIQTLELGNRPIEPEMLAYVSQVRFENWLRTQRDAAVIEKYWG